MLRVPIYQRLAGIGHDPPVVDDDWLRPWILVLEGERPTDERQTTERRSDANHAADVAVRARKFDRRRLCVRPPEVVIAVEIASGRSPGNFLQIREKWMTHLRRPVAPELATPSFHQQLVGSTQKLIIHELARVDVAESSALLP